MQASSPHLLYIHALLYYRLDMIGIIGTYMVGTSLSEPCLAGKVASQIKNGSVVRSGSETKLEHRPSHSLWLEKGNRGNSIAVTIFVISPLVCLLQQSLLYVITLFLNHLKIRTHC